MDAINGRVEGLRSTNAALSSPAGTHRRFSIPYPSFREWYHPFRAYHGFCEGIDLGRLPNLWRRTWHTRKNGPTTDDEHRVGLELAGERSNSPSRRY